MISSIVVINDRGKDISPLPHHQHHTGVFNHKGAAAVQWAHDIEVREANRITVTVRGEIQTATARIPFQLSEEFERDCDFSIEPSYKTIADT